MPEERGGRPVNKGLREAAPYMGLGLQLAGAMALFAFGGYAVDRWLGTSPWGLVAGAVLGMAAVFAQVLRVNDRLVQKERRESAARGRRAGGPDGGRGSTAPGAEMNPARGPGSTPPAPVAEAMAFPENSSPGAEGALALSELERAFRSAGEVRDGVLVLSAWDAADLVEAARKAYVPVLGVHTYVLAGAGLRHVDALDLSRQARQREGWDEAARFIDELRGSDLRFRVVLGEPS